MGWEKYIKRYVWDDERTPYLTPVARLTRNQADHEVFAYTVFLAFLFMVVAVMASVGRLGGGAAPLVALYAFSVLAAAALLGWSKHPGAAWYLAATPLLGLLHLALGGFPARLGMVDHLLIVGFLLLWTRYGWRVVKLANAYPTMAEGTATPNPRRRWHWPKE